MKNIFSILGLIISVSILAGCQPQKQVLPLEKIKLNFENNEAVSYSDVISFYESLAGHYSEAEIFEYGFTDIGKPLHLFVISEDGDFDPASVRSKHKRIVLINNGIHPGEPCGVDASLQFAKDLLENKDNLKRLLTNTVICIIPVYNIGGYFNQSKFWRTNQDTPEINGFRGNARNLDLNRDFVKADSENAKSFSRIFQHWRPDVFLDTHTTNGSDHQYAITLIAQHSVSMHPKMGKYFDETMVPALYKKMDEGEYEMIPYIYSLGRSPDDKGIVNYIATPRFSTGYSALFNNFCFMTENHVYKEFKDRVKSVYNFIKALSEFTNDNAYAIGEVIQQANEETKSQKEFVLNWELDENKYDTIKDFKGFELKKKKSKLTGLDRYYYDRNSPFTKDIKYFTYYNPAEKITVPQYYIIPQAWWQAIWRLQLNGVEMHQLTKDTLITCEIYYIENNEFSSRPYNGHFVHNNFETRVDTQQIQYRRGDFLIETNQINNKYIVNVLEPKAPDSYFRWNFFDSIFDRREYFSTYNFEEKATEILESNPDLKKEFEKKRKTDKEFAANYWVQLNYIYTRSDYYEKSHLRYPVGRILN